MTRESELLSIIKSDERLMNILRVARDCNLPNWYVGAGVVRNTVWDSLSGSPGASHIRDIDFIYFSEFDIDEADIRSFLEERLPGVDWDFKNSRDIHKWYKEKKGIDRDPLMSSEEDIDNWPEFCSCIGIRLKEDGEILIYAPYGIDDLMNMVFRRNTFSDHFTSGMFEQRVKDKKVVERWPKAKIIYG